MTPEKLLKLPIWAQQHVKALTEDRDYWRDRAEDKELKDGRIFLKQRMGKPDIAVGTAWDELRFCTGFGTRGIEDFLDVRLDRDNWADGELLIMGGRGVSLFPQSSNAVRIRNQGYSR